MVLKLGLNTICKKPSLGTTEVCQRAKERSMLGGKWQDHIRNTELRSKTKVVDVGKKTVHMMIQMELGRTRVSYKSGPVD